MKNVEIRKNYLITIEQDSNLSHLTKRAQKRMRKYLKEYEFFTFDYFSGDIIEAYTHNKEHLKLN